MSVPDRWLMVKSYYLCFVADSENGKPEAKAESVVSEDGTKEECDVKQEDLPVNETVAENGNAANGSCPCELKKESAPAIVQPGHPLFLVKSWRSQLCRCPNCLRTYKENHLGFLLDSDDTLQVIDSFIVVWPVQYTHFAF